MLLNFQVAKLREELSIRNLSTKGLKSQLTMRLAKALKDEETLETEAKAKEEKLGEDGEEKKEQVTEENSSAISEVVEESSAAGIRLVDPSSILEESLVVEESITTATTTEKADDDNDEDKKDEKMEDGEIDEEEVEVKNDGKSVGEGGIIREGMSAEEKSIWERRFALPKNPKILIYPSTNVKGGIFDCSSMTLSSLRDYRVVDRKEESFEVSLFSELFYEMLNRDFAFRIYQEIVRRAAKSSEHTKVTLNLIFTYVGL